MNVLIAGIVLLFGQAGSQQGVTVIDVTPGGIGATIGIRAGDTLLSYDARTVRTPFELDAFEKNVRRGREVDVVWSSAGKRKTGRAPAGVLGVRSTPVLSPEAAGWWRNAERLRSEERFVEAGEALDTALTAESDPRALAWLWLERFLVSVSAQDAGRASNALRRAIETADAMEDDITLWNVFNWVAQSLLPTLSMDLQVEFPERRRGTFQARLEGRGLIGPPKLEFAKGVVLKGDRLAPSDLAELEEYPALADEVALLRIGDAITVARDLKEPAKVKAKLEEIIRTYPKVPRGSVIDTTNIVKLQLQDQASRPSTKTIADWLLKRLEESDVFGVGGVFGFLLSTHSEFGPSGDFLDSATLAQLRQSIAKRFPNTPVHAHAIFLEASINVSRDALSSIADFEEVVRIVEALGDGPERNTLRSTILAASYNLLMLRALATSRSGQAARLLAKRPRLEDIELRFGFLNAIAEAAVLQLSGRPTEARLLYDASTKKNAGVGLNDPMMNLLRNIAAGIMKRADPTSAFELLGQDVGPATALFQSGANAPTELLRRLETMLAGLPETSSDREVIATMLATFALRAGEPARALGYAKDGFASFLRRRGEFAFPESRKQLSQFAGAIAPWLLADAQLELGKAPEALETLETVRSLALAEAIVLDGTSYKDSAALRDLDTARIERRQAALEVERSDATQKIEALRRLNDAIQTEDEAFEDLRKSDPRFQSLALPKPVTAGEAMTLIRPGEVLATGVVTDRAVWAIFADRKKIWARKSPLKPADLRKMVNEFRSSCASLRTPLSAADLAKGAKIYDTLFGPIHDRIVKGERLLVVPDPVLENLPFAALPARGKFLVERTTLRFEPSLTVMRVNRSRVQGRAPGQKWLLAGDPYYTMALPSQKSPALPRLKATRKEVESLASRLSNRSPSVLLGAAARPSEVLKGLSQSGAAHIACHGRNERDRPLLSRLILSPEFGNPGGSIAAYDLLGSTFPLELLVFGACEVGGGQASEGEGVDGLGRTFLYAGARTIVASIQEIEDGAASRLFDAFYDEVFKGRRVDDALRLAQARLARQKLPPGTWAGFRSLGEGGSLPAPLRGR